MIKIPDHWKSMGVKDNIFICTKHGFHFDPKRELCMDCVDEGLVQAPPLQDNELVDWQK